MTVMDMCWFRGLPPRWQWMMRRYNDAGRRWSNEGENKEEHASRLTAWRREIRLFWPGLVRGDADLLAFARQARPEYEGRVRDLWDGLETRTSPRDTPAAKEWRESNFQVSNLMFEVQDRLVSHLLDLDKERGNREARERHECLRIASRHARFEFETFWAFGVKLIALGNRPRDVWDTPERLGSQARDLDFRYAKAMEAAYEDVDASLRARCGRGLDFLLDAWRSSVDTETEVHALGIRQPPWTHTDLFRNPDMWQASKPLAEIIRKQ